MSVNRYDYILGGKSFYELGIRVLEESQIPVLPEVLDHVVELQGKQGSYDFGASRLPFMFVLRCKFINVNSPIDIQGKARMLAAHLSNHDGSPKTMKFTMPMEPDLYYNVRYVETSELERFSKIGIFELMLAAHDPFPYGESKGKEFSNNLATVYNAGTAYTYPEFIATFTNEASEWVVHLLDTTKYIRIVRDFEIGDVLEINCATGDIKVNGVRALVNYDWQHSEMFWLPPGESTLKVEPSGVSDVFVGFEERWL